MAIGKKSDMVLYNDEFYAGIMEMEVSNVNLFNAASLGTLVLETQASVRGDYRKRSFLDKTADPTRRDDTSVSSATDTALTMDEEIGVKVKRKYGPFAQTVDAWRAIAEDEREMSFILGQRYAEKKMKDMRNTLVLALETWISGETGLNYDATGQSTKTLIPDHLNEGLKKFGDAQEDILIWLCHSTPWFDYRKQGIADKVDTVYTGILTQYTMGGLGRPFAVQDIAALTDDNGSLTDTYNTLGLVAGAGSAVESGPDMVAFERVTGLENLVYRFQAEYEYVVTCKGAKWDTTNGGANPTDAALGTATNWDPSVAEDKNKSGVRVKTQ